MAKENIAFLVNLRKNIVEGSKMEGRYYPEAESKEALTTKGFARHVADHGGMVTYEFMQLVLASIVKCLKEMMSHGQPVKLDGLGTFRPTVTSIPGGAASIEEALRVGVKTVKKKINGKEKSYTLRTPLSAWDIIQDEDPTSGSGSESGNGSGSGGSNDDNNNDAPPVINPDTDHPSDGD